MQVHVSFIEFIVQLQQQGSMYKITGENCESLLAIKQIACDVRLLDPLLTLGVLRVTVPL